MIILLIPCMVIAGPATAGVVYVIRNWARDEHAWLWSDFKDAWKQNWKESLLIMLINGLALFVFYINMNFYAVQAQKGLIYIVLRYIVIMIGIIYCMMNMFIFPMLVTYKLKLRQIFKNALIFTMAELPRTFAIFVLAFLLFGIVFYYSIPFIIPFFIIGLTFPMFIAISYVNWVFDKYLNKEPDEQNEISAKNGS
ncbi:MAG: YesL family protein [Caldicoprobacterales bacterium]